MRIRVEEQSIVVSCLSYSFIPLVVVSLLQFLSFDFGYYFFFCISISSIFSWLLSIFICPSNFLSFLPHIPFFFVISLFRLSNLSSFQILNVEIFFFKVFKLNLYWMKIIIYDKKVTKSIKTKSLQSQNKLQNILQTSSTYCFKSTHLIS